MMLKSLINTGETLIMKILVLENENIDSYGFQSLDDDYIDEIVKQDWNDVAIDDNDQYWNYNKIVNKLDYQFNVKELMNPGTTVMLLMKFMRSDLSELG